MLRNKKPEGQAKFCSQTPKQALSQSSLTITMPEGRDKDLPAISDGAGDGYIIDYISGSRVKDTPEEREAVQVFARRLVEDYGYSKEQIQTHTQFRVRKRPSDQKKS